MAVAPVAGPADAAAGGFAAAVVLAGPPDVVLNQVVVGQRVGCRKLCTELQGQRYRKEMVC